jgi:hypothetical protein
MLLAILGFSATQSTFIFPHILSVDLEGEIWQKCGVSDTMWYNRVDAVDF